MGLKYETKTGQDQARDARRYTEGVGLPVGMDVLCCQCGCSTSVGAYSRCGGHCMGCSQSSITQSVWSHRADTEGDNCRGVFNQRGVYSRGGGIQSA